MEDSIFLGDNLDVLPRIPEGTFQLVYADPPFNTAPIAMRPAFASGAGIVALANAQVK